MDGDSLSSAARPVPKEDFLLGDWLVQPSLNLVSRDGVSTRLEPKVMQVLVCLADHAGEVISKEQLIARVWSDTFVADQVLTHAIWQLRQVFGDDPKHPLFIETIPKSGYRLTATVRTSAAEAGQETIAISAPQRKRPWVKYALASAVVLIVAAAITSYLHLHRPPVLTEKDTFLLADFNNSTGDPVFDGTLRQGLAVQLQQSPFLSLVLDEQVQQTLRMMKQPPDAKLTPEIAREVCQRTGGAIVLDGSISQFGTQYNLILKAENCLNGEFVASTEAQATDKNHVLEALEKASSAMRRKLGESSATVQKFDVPLVRATTPSLDALRSYSLGLKQLNAGDNTDAIALIQQAIRFDPIFALAYDTLGGCQWNLGEYAAASENLRKAFGLRAGVNERERFSIESHYYDLVPGDLEKGIQIYELWAQTFPRDFAPRNDVAIDYLWLGQYDKALAELREAVRLCPECGLSRGNLVSTYIDLNRPEEARAALLDAKGKVCDMCAALDGYGIAFLQNDRQEMERQATLAVEHPDWEYRSAAIQSDTAAYSGQLEKARVLSRRAIAAAERRERKETAATYQAVMALKEALFGNKEEARQQASAALRLSSGRAVQYGAALALASAGETVRAQALADDLAKRFPEDTIVRFNYLPTLRGQLALSRDDAPKAIETLEAAAPYELGDIGIGTLFPIYFRGFAYLAARRGSEAAAEFRRILDRPGIVSNSPIGPLARLQMARAYVLQGDTAKARAAYLDFLTLWKDADPNVPILKQAKAEYARLH